MSINSSTGPLPESIVSTAYAKTAVIAVAMTQYGQPFSELLDVATATMLNTTTEPKAINRPNLMAAHVGIDPICKANSLTASRSAVYLECSNADVSDLVYVDNRDKATIIIVKVRVQLIHQAGYRVARHLAARVRH